MDFTKRIDTHAHFLPPFYRQALEENGHSHPDGMPAVPQWSEEGHLSLMKKLNISKSVLSISTPGTYLKHGDLESAKSLSRKCNDYAADMVSRYPSQFGFWASLPLPDIDASLEELSYALDTLHADGVTMESNHHGFYLGDKVFDPIFDELNKRHAKLFIHPTSPCRAACNGQGPTSLAPLTQYPNPMFEFMFESARALINLFLSGTITRCPNITFIIPHAGAALPPVIERFTGFSALLGGDSAVTSQVVKETFSRQFYFDLAGLPFPDQVYMILRYVGKDKLLYGSDYPFTNDKVVLRLAEVMDKEIGAWGNDDLEKIMVSNAERLLGNSTRGKL